MCSIFIKALNLSINASWLILAVIVARLLLKKAPRWISCLLWGMVALRLICPVSIESVLSLLPSAEVVPGNIQMVERPYIDSGISIIDNNVNPGLGEALKPGIEDSMNPMQGIVAAGMMWIVGIAIMLVYALVSFLILKKRVRASVSAGEGIYECDEVESPFILGILKPIIYVPSGLDEKILDMVLAHEYAHLKRHDHWWKPFGYALLSVYWFNLLCRDIEAACDERVIRDQTKEYAADYSQALLSMSVRKRFIAACPIAFGETGVKSRIKGVLNYRKPAFWVVIAAFIICVAVAIFFMTNPKDDHPNVSISSTLNEETRIKYQNEIRLNEIICDYAPDVIDFTSANISIQDGLVNCVNVVIFCNDKEKASEVQNGIADAVSDYLGIDTKSVFMAFVDHEGNPYLYYGASLEARDIYEETSHIYSLPDDSYEAPDNVVTESMDYLPTEKIIIDD